MVPCEQAGGRLPMLLLPHYITRLKGRLPAQLCFLRASTQPGLFLMEDTSSTAASIAPELSLQALSSWGATASQ